VISKHMRVLENAGLISRRVIGREHHCRLNVGALDSAEYWIHFHLEFWESRLDCLNELTSQKNT
jgi:DNA-binding transcriptional ArsR family regulator